MKKINRESTLEIKTYEWKCICGHYNHEKCTDINHINYVYCEECNTNFELED